MARFSKEFRSEMAIWGPRSALGDQTASYSEEISKEMAVRAPGRARGPQTAR